MASEPSRKYSSPRQQDRRKRILKATAAHLVKHGLETISMQGIAQDSGVSVKTLYNLFGSRDELLLKAGTRELSNLESSDTILRVEEGLPRLLAYVVATMDDFVAAPKYAHAIISTLAKADLTLDLADHHMGVVRRYAEASLLIAKDQGELRADVDTAKLARHISADQWGAVLLWVKGLLPVEDLPDHVAFSHYATLLAVTRGRRRDLMEQQFEALITNSLSIP